MDLVKAYDQVNWDFLRFLLLRIGFNWQVRNWILGFITSRNFVVLINGSPSAFFTASRGLRRGCKGIQAHFYHSFAFC